MQEIGRAGAPAAFAGLWRLPAMRAAGLQAVSFALVLSVVAACRFLLDFPLPAVAAALLQGCCAMVLSRCARLAPWWMGIQFVFPLGLVLGLRLHLPSSFFLLAFVCLLLLYWTTFRTQVPFFPSNRQVWEAVAKLLPNDGTGLRFADIGSGFGGLILHLAAHSPQAHFLGVELAPMPWLASRLRARVQGSSARFLRADYHHLDLAEFDVVFAYLSPAAMPALWRKASKEMRRGSVLLSYEFAIPGVEPQRILYSGPGKVKLHLFQL